MMVQPKAAGAGGWRRAAGIPALGAVVLTLLVLAFAWPAARSDAAGLAIGVTGPSQLVDTFTAGLRNGLGEAVEVSRVDDRAAIVAGVESRELIGGVVLTQDHPEVLLASAAGQVPSAVMTGLAATLQRTLDSQAYTGVLSGLTSAAQHPGGDSATAVSHLPSTLPSVTVTDLVPLSAGDSNGVGLTIAVIPLTVGALLAGIAIAATVTGVRRRLTALVGLAAGGGLLLTVVLGTWLQVYPGPFGIVWLALSLSLLATSGLFAGLHSVFGYPGFGIGALITLFAGVPWAAFAVPYQFLPADLGRIGQWLIPGAATTLTRSVSYFPDASAARTWWVLILWAAAGAALVIAGRVINRTRDANPTAR